VRIDTRKYTAIESRVEVKVFHVRTSVRLLPGSRVVLEGLLLSGTLSDLNIVLGQANIDYEPSNPCAAPQITNPQAAHTKSMIQYTAILLKSRRRAFTSVCSVGPTTDTELRSHSLPLPFLTWPG
jgi:hypothetical protein